MKIILTSLGFIEAFVNSDVVPKVAPIHEVTNEIQIFLVLGRVDHIYQEPKRIRNAITDGAATKVASSRS